MRYPEIKIVSSASAPAAHWQVSTTASRRCRLRLDESCITTEPNAKHWIRELEVSTVDNIGIMVSSPTHKGRVTLQRLHQLCTGKQSVWR